MKHIVYAAIIGASIALASCSEHGEKECLVDDPHYQEVHHALISQYPDAQSVQWESTTNYNVARFSHKYSSGNKSAQAWYTRECKWKLTITPLSIDELPEAVKTAFATTEYATWTVVKVGKIERPEMDVLYCIEAVNNTETADNEVKLLFSVDGELVKTDLDVKNHDDEDYIAPASMEAVKAYVNEYYPGARILDIENEHGNIEVEIFVNGRKLELLFAADGTLLRSEEKLFRTTEVPAAVSAALAASDYASYIVKCIKHIVTPEKESYILELISQDRRAKVEIEIDLQGNLTVLKENTNNGHHGEGNKPGYNKELPTEVSAFIAEKYAGATVLKFKYEHRGYEVEIQHEGLVKELFFDAKGAWICSEWELARTQLPEAVTAAIAASEYASYKIDEVEYFESPSEAYYVVEFKARKHDITVCFAPDGTIVRRR